MSARWLSRAGRAQTSLGETAVPARPAPRRVPSPQPLSANDRSQWRAELGGGAGAGRKRVWNWIVAMAAQLCGCIRAPRALYKGGYEVSKKEL